MKIRMLRFRLKMVYRLAVYADRVFRWGCKRHSELCEQIKGVRRND